MKFTVIHSYFIILISFYREKQYTTTPLTMVCTHAGALTVLTSSGRMKTMRKHRNQARRVANRTIRCCLRKSPYRWSRKSARKNTTTTSSASATPLILTALSHMKPVRQARDTPSTQALFGQSNFSKIPNLHLILTLITSSSEPDWQQCVCLWIKNCESPKEISRLNFTPKIKRNYVLH